MQFANNACSMKFCNIEITQYENCIYIIEIMFEVGHSSLQNENLICFLNKNWNKKRVLSPVFIKMKIFIFLLFYFRKANASCSEAKIRLALRNREKINFI